MRSLKVTIAAACLATLVGCGNRDAANDASPPLLGAASVGSIGDEPIPESLYRRLGLNMLQKPAENMSEDERNAVMDQLVAMMLVSKQGVADGLDRELNVAAELELRRMQYLASETVERYLAENPPSEADLRELYEERIQNLSGAEYKAGHILLETEEKAAEVIALLDAGGDFAALAEEHSTGPTGPSGGDLGWFTPDRMVEPFAQAVLATPVGSYSKTPVRTQYGWHVILVEDSRDQQPPGIESMRTELVTIARRQKVDEYIAMLKRQAGVAPN